MRLTDLPEYLMTQVSVPNNVRSKLSKLASLHSDIIEYVNTNFKNSNQFKRLIINVINSVTYYVLRGDYIEYNLTTDVGVNSVMLVDDSLLKKSIGNLYVDFNNIDWDSDNFESTHSDLHTDFEPVVDVASESSIDPTNKVSSESDISLSFPKVPRFDPNKVWAIGKDIYGRLIPIHPTLPEIPTVQNEISITTDVSKFSKQDLLNLFPNKRLKPRHDELYQKIDGFEWDPVLGYIPKILDFTKEQIVENLIKYPKFNYMYREFGEDNRVNFTSFLESNENLVPLKVAVEVVPDMVALPKSKIFYMDYIVRRYLLERDVLGIEHKFPMYGTFDPFMTLFTTMEEYAALGYSDFESMAKQCVIGRVKFYQSRNPLVRGLLNESRIS